MLQTYASKAALIYLQILADNRFSCLVTTEQRRGSHSHIPDIHGMRNTHARTFPHPSSGIVYVRTLKRTSCWVCYPGSPSDGLYTKMSVCDPETPTQCPFFLYHRHSLLKPLQVCFSDGVSLIKIAVQ